MVEASELNWDFVQTYWKPIGTGGLKDGSYAICNMQYTKERTVRLQNADTHFLDGGKQRQRIKRLKRLTGDSSKPGFSASLNARWGFKRSFGMSDVICSLEGQLGLLSHPHRRDKLKATSKTLCFGSVDDPGGLRA